MKKSDLYLALAILLAALALYLFFRVGKEAGAAAIVTVDGEEIARLPLETDAIYTVEGDYTNIVQVEDGSVSVVYADCPDQICVETGHIYHTGQTITCLPNRMVVEVTGAEEFRLDAVVR